MMPDGPSFLMRQLFPDNHESHACADKLAKTAKGFNYFTTEELEAQRKAFDEFRKSMDVLCKAFSAFANETVALLQDGEYIYSSSPTQEV